MTLLEFIKQFPEGEEITVYDNIYDMETYFYNDAPSDEWDRAMLKLASKLDVVGGGGDTDYAIVNLTELIERNIDNPIFEELFIDVDVDAIMEDMGNILAGYVSEKWLTTFVNCLK